MKIEDFDKLKGYKRPRVCFVKKGVPISDFLKIKSNISAKPIFTVMFIYEIAVKILLGEMVKNACNFNCYLSNLKNLKIKIKKSIYFA